MRRVPRALGVLGSVSGLIAGLLATGVASERFVLGVQPGESSTTSRFIGGVAVAAALAALAGVVLERRAPRTALALLIGSAVSGFIGARGYWTVPSCLLLAAAVSSLALSRGGGAVDRSRQGRRSRVAGAVVGTVGGLAGVAGGLVLLGALGSYFALGPGGGQTYLEMRTIAASVVLTGVIGVGGALVSPSRPRFAWPLLAFAAAYGNVPVPVTWMIPAGSLLAVAAVLAWSAARPPARLGTPA